MWLSESAWCHTVPKSSRAPEQVPWSKVSLVALALLSKAASVLCHSKEGRLGNADGWLCAAFLGESAF